MQLVSRVVFKENINYAPSKYFSSVTSEDGEIQFVGSAIVVKLPGLEEHILIPLSNVKCFFIKNYEKHPGAPKK